MTSCHKVVHVLFSVHGFAGQEESQNIWNQVSVLFTIFEFINFQNTVVKFQRVSSGTSPGLLVTTS